jgi:hypothetical protein
MPYTFKIPAPQKSILPVGEHEVKITKVAQKDRDGNPLRSKNGDPQINLHIEGDAGVLDVKITLPELDGEGNPAREAGVHLLRILGQIVSACGNPSEEGSVCELSSATFLNKSVRVIVDKRTGTDGKEYSQVKTWLPAAHVDNVKF